MKEPARLFSCDPELARIRMLLDRDDPPDGAAERVLAKVGGAARSPEGWRASSSTLKLVFVAGVALLAVAAAEVAHTGRPTASESLGAPSVAPVPVASTGTASSATNAPIVETVRIEDLPPAVAHTASPSPPVADPFLLELALVEQARAELSKGRGRECLDVVARHGKRFSNKGHFTEEVEVMRIEALAITHERAQAHARAARFLKEHGETPYAERVRRVLQESAGEP